MDGIREYISHTLEAFSIAEFNLRLRSPLYKKISDTTGKVFSYLSFGKTEN